MWKYIVSGTIAFAIEDVISRYFIDLIFDVFTQGQPLDTGLLLLKYVAKLAIFVIFLIGFKELFDRYFNSTPSK
jgi:hypothetical protein